MIQNDSGCLSLMQGRVSLMQGRVSLMQGCRLLRAWKWINRYLFCW